MDPASHTAWSYVLWHKSPMVWPALVAGLLPDLIGGVPPAIAAGISNRSWKSLFTERPMPGWAQKYKDVAHPIMHSIIISSIVWGIVALVWGPQWWLLAWPLHTVFDLVSHTSNVPKGEQVRSFYPLSNRPANMISWKSRKFLVLNFTALAIVAAFAFW